mmetsp:Transcript_31189/g.78928  ORF Transcript_31189/g.78928 Transcript_31189/m.78928 type:complete len:213 (-) Transcript_31189:293-931(-)
MERQARLLRPLPHGECDRPPRGSRIRPRFGLGLEVVCHAGPLSRWLRCHAAALCMGGAVLPSGEARADRVSPKGSTVGRRRPRAGSERLVLQARLAARFPAVEPAHLCRLLPRVHELADARWFHARCGGASGGGGTSGVGGSPRASAAPFNFRRLVPHLQRVPRERPARCHRHHSRTSRSTASRVESAAEQRLVRSIGRRVFRRGRCRDHCQ